MKIGIIGAGITGLALGWFLKARFQNNITLKILEKSDRAGGWISSSSTSGFLFERGPRGIRPKGKGEATVELIKALGLENKVVASKASSRFLLQNGKLASPLSFSLLPCLLKDLVAPRGDPFDESVAAFCRRRFGNIIDSHINPLCSGIFAQDPEELSVSACFPSWKEAEKKSRSLLLHALFQKRKKTPSLISFKEGMQTLPDRLKMALEKELIFNEEIVSINCPKQEIQVKSKKGTEFGFDHVFIATNPSFLVRTLPSVSLVVVNFGFSSQVLPKQGFGYLVPKKEKEDILGVVFDSAVFPDQNLSPEETRLTVMMKMIDLEDSKIFSLAESALARHLGITKSADAKEIFRAPNAIGRYNVGHLDKVSEIQRLAKKVAPNLHVLGAYLDGVAVNDCISIAKNVATTLSLE